MPIQEFPYPNKTACVILYLNKVPNTLVGGFMLHACILAKLQRTEVLSSDLTMEWNRAYSTTEEWWGQPINIMTDVQLRDAQRTVSALMAYDMLEALEADLVLQYLDAEVLERASKEEARQRTVDLLKIPESREKLFSK